MSLARFLTALIEHGRVLVPPPNRADLQDQAAASAALEDMDRLGREDVPGTAPPLHPPAALWAAQTLYRACQLVAFRDIGPEAMEKAFSGAVPTGPPASIHHSVDLTLRFLPDLFRLAAAASRSDPLLEHLRRLGQAWPLSSVGMPDLGPIDVSPVTGNECLLRIYVDRIVQRRDIPRLADAHVAAAVRSALGMHASLAPEIAAALDRQQTTQQQQLTQQQQTSSSTAPTA